MCKYSAILDISGFFKNLTSNSFFSCGNITDILHRYYTLPEFQANSRQPEVQILAILNFKRPPFWNGWRYYWLRVVRENFYIICSFEWGTTKGVYPFEKKVRVRYPPPPRGLPKNFRGQTVASFDLGTSSKFQISTSIRWKLKGGGDFSNTL